MKIWTDADFGEISWHDNHVHALRIEEGEYGLGDLILDLDYILEWVPAGAEFQFKMVPVTLRFKGVSNLRIAIDYAEDSAAMSPFSIHGIERRPEQREQYTAQCWEIGLNWPDGEIAFEATGFVQEAWGLLRSSNRQVLAQQERVRAA